MDITDLNRACLKDLFPMPKIDQLVDPTYGHSRMSFLDAFQGYHQITLAAKDQEKTALSLHRDALWAKECQGDISADDDENVSG